MPHKGKSRAALLSEPTVPMSIVVHCPPGQHRQPVLVCFHNLRNVPDHPYGCNGCSVIQNHIEKFGERTTKRVPVSCTALALSFKDRKGQVINTTKSEWGKMIVMGEERFFKRIDGQLHHFTVAEAANMGIPEAIASVAGRVQRNWIPSATLLKPQPPKKKGLKLDAGPELNPAVLIKAEAQKFRSKKLRLIAIERLRKRHIVAWRKAHGE